MNFPNHRDAAERLDPGLEDGEGVRNDELMDARIELENATHLLSEAYVNLDTAADNPGLFPEEVETAIRECESQLMEINEWVEAYTSAVSKIDE